MMDFRQRRVGPLRRVVRKAAEIIPMALVPRRVLPRLDREVFRLTRGRTTFSAWVSGLPIVMLTTTGARTGEARTLPILGLLRAHPRAVISWEGSNVEIHARELKGDERQRYLDRSHQAYPWWEEYHRHAAPRQIPVIMLEPLSEPEH
jgi:hypothetical protein